jgi:hypothetical protein
LGISAWCARLQLTAPTSCAAGGNCSQQRKLPNLQGIPMLIVVSEASYYAPYDHCTAKYLAQAEVRNTFVRLPEVGIRGNGHLMMLEKNNMDIATFLVKWAQQNIQ